MSEKTLDHPARAHALPRRDRRDVRGLRRASCARRRRSRGACTSCTARIEALRANVGKKRLEIVEPRGADDVVQVTERVEGEPAFLARARRRSTSDLEARLDARVQAAARRVAGDEAPLRRREVPVPGARQGHRARPRRPSRSRTCAIPKVALPRYEDWGDVLTWLLRESAARAVPVHRRRLPAQARGRRPGAHVRRRRRPGAHQQALPLRLARPAGEAPLDGVRLGDALRRGSRSPAGHLRQGRQLGRLDRERRRREEALLRLRSRRSDDVGVDDDQRSGADAARLLPERRDRPAVREVDPRAGQGRRGRGEDRRDLRRSAACRGRATRASCPRATTASACMLLGVSGDEVLPREVYEKIRAATLSAVRGTVQADILKEDQAQNTCIFSTEFALRLMGDIQQYFIDKKVRNFYSVSISGYHIAEAGANPISQLAFTLANGFTFVEYYLSRGMHIDDFAPNLSFFFSNGMDPEYAVIGRVARRIWAQGDPRQVRRQRPLAEAQVPHPDVGPLAARAGDRLQRHPHDAAGAARAQRQLQLAAHQRLRRGDHDADRGERAARDGHPAHHQQGVRARRRTRTRSRARSSSRS